MVRLKCLVKSLTLVELHVHLVEPLRNHPVVAANLGEELDSGDVTQAEMPWLLSPRVCDAQLAGKSLVDVHAPVTVTAEC